jgi:hypothetical protein
VLPGAQGYMSNPNIGNLAMDLIREEVANRAPDADRE